MKIGVLALQGAFIEHEKMLAQCGAEAFEIRQLQDFQTSFDGLILPGGESTTMGKLLNELSLMEPIRESIKSGVPVMGTCAGMILLAEHIFNDDTVHLGTMGITVRRNAYGRQLGSFQTIGSVGTIDDFPMTFIRAPYITEASKDVSVLSTVDSKIVGVQYKNQIGLAFHPEVTDDLRIHKLFLEIVQKHKEQG